jgi:protein-tyrosine phosphatase
MTFAIAERRAPMTATTDIHFHLLPGVDDGPATMDESLALAAAAVRDGSATVVATPHVRTDFITDVSDLGERVRELQCEIDRAGIPLGVCRGAELGHDMVGRLHQSELDSIALGPPGARWLLVETPFTGLDAEFAAAADELRDRGFGVVLAHPERGAGILDDDCAAVRQEIAQGSALQVNASSLVGSHGDAAHLAAARLLLERHATILGSDAHGESRAPALSNGLKSAVRIGLEPGAAAALVSSAPAQLIARGIPARAELSTAA